MRLKVIVAHFESSNTVNSPYSEYSSERRHIVNILVKRFNGGSLGIVSPFSEQNAVANCVHHIES